MNLVDLLKKNIVMVPVVASVLVGTFTGVRYIVNLTDTINQNELRLTNLERDVSVLEKIGRAHVRTPVTRGSRMPSSA